MNICASMLLVSAAVNIVQITVSTSFLNRKFNGQLKLRKMLNISLRRAGGGNSRYCFWGGLTRVGRLFVLVILILN